LEKQGVDQSRDKQSPPIPFSVEEITSFGAAPPPAARFCGRCGAPLDPSHPECMGCVAKPQTILYQPTVAHPVAPVMALYFAFLASSAVAIIAVLAGADVIKAEIATILIDTLLVLMWCIPARRLLTPALFRAINFLWFPAGVGGGVLTFLVASLMLWTLHAAFGIPVLDASRDFLSHGYGWSSILLITCIQPAIIEEIAFRGIIFGSLQGILSTNETIIVSACMFSILHLSIPSFPHLLIIGVALGVLRARSGSLFPGMCLHFTHNLLCILSEAKGW
jgi:membrane protease YdiL (CAAX protease family)